LIPASDAFFQRLSVISHEERHARSWVARRRREKEHGEISGRKKTPWLEGEQQMGECGAGEEGVIASRGVESGWMQTHLLREGATLLLRKQREERPLVPVAYRNRD